VVDKKLRTGFRVLEKWTLFPLSEGFPWRTPGHVSDIDFVGTSVWLCWRIVQHETCQPWRTNLCYSHSYESESGL